MRRVGVDILGDEDLGGVVGGVVVGRVGVEILGDEDLGGVVGGVVVGGVVDMLALSSR
jgi:hypothetical protein